MSTSPRHPSGLDASRADMLRASGGDPLRAFVAGLLRQTWLIFSIFALLCLTALVVITNLPGRFKSEATILIQPGSNLADQTPANLQTPPEIVRSQLEVIKSPTVIARVVDQLGLMNDPEFAPEGALANSNAATRRAAVISNIIEDVEAENDGRSSTIRLSFESKSPVKASRITDGISKEFIYAATQLKNVSVGATKARLDAELQSLRFEAIRAEQEAENFRRSAGLVWLAPASDSSDSGGGVTYQSRLLDQLSRQAADMSASAALARAKQASGAANSPEILESNAINTMLQRDAELAETEASMATRYNAQYPPLLRVRTQRARLRSTLNSMKSNVASSINIEAARAEAANRAAGAKAVALERVVNQQIADGVRYRQMQRDALSKRRAYERVSEQSSLVSQRLMLQLPNAVIVSPASLPIKEVWPNRTMFYLISCGAALILACFVGLLRELTRRPTKAATLKKSILAESRSEPLFRKSPW